ncbi:MAG: hypothetical protein HY832_03020 [Candidatus Aenigmarchaeota archaeon]|nr:hypothetical protein [Candidatus Aenigmarchaeota archaeon]
MKGVVDIEFMISLFMFLVTISFITYTIAGNLPRYHEEATVNHLRSVAFQASELLLFDKGNPQDWQSESVITDVNQIGLAADKKYKIDSVKIAALNKYCTNEYDAIKNKIIHDDALEMNLTILYPPYAVHCAPPSISETKNRVKIVRYAVVGLQIARIELTVMGS